MQVECVCVCLCVRVGEWVDECVRKSKNGWAFFGIVEVCVERLKGG